MAKWMFYDYTMHPENPFYKCGACGKLHYMPSPRCPHCNTVMYIPKEQKKYLPERYKHLAG